MQNDDIDYLPGLEKAEWRRVNGALTHPDLREPDYGQRGESVKHWKATGFTEEQTKHGLKQKG